MIAKREHLKILKQGVEGWNEWRQENPDVMPDLTSANLIEADLTGVNLTKANLVGANLFYATLSEANLSYADLYRASLTDANLSKADLTHTTLIEADLIGADLTKIKLTGADLSDADLIRTTLIEADLTKVYLTRGHLTDANLARANLTGANLTNANFLGADLTRANLTRADFSGANLTDTDLTGANLTKTRLYNTTFANVCLKDVKGLRKCRHDGLSIVDHRTIQRSGILPVEFLRGCGLPDTVIETYCNLVDQPFYSCFISYSMKDKKFVEKLYSSLQDKGIRCWYAGHDMQSGQKIHEQIKKAIQSHDRLLLVLSENSMNSEWVNTEIASARERESKENKQMLFPIRLVDFESIQGWECFDADRGKDSAKEIREYYIPDFQNWQDEKSYQKSFERLLRDIKAQPSAS